MTEESSDYSHFGAYHSRAGPRADAFLLTGIAIIFAVFASSASAASTNSSGSNSLFIQMWSTDLGGEINDLKLVDLNSDGSGEVVASSLYTSSFGKSGTIFGLDGRGQQVWKFLAGLLEDSYTTERGYTVVGSGPYLEFIGPSGQEAWKRATRVSAAQSITAQKVYAADVNGDGKDDALVGTSMGTKGASLTVWDSAGGELATIPFKNLDTPSAIDVADLSGDGRKEIMVGTVKYAPNTIGGVYQAAHSKPTVFSVFTSTGALLWSDNFPASVTAVKACDLDADGNLEVLAGSQGKLSAYSVQGKRMWDAKIDGQAYSIDCGSLEGNKTMDVVVGAGNVYAFNGATGKQLWMYGSGTALAVKVYDFGQTGTADVVIGTSSVRVVDSAGQMVYRSEAMGQVTSLGIGKMGSLLAIVAGSKDHRVRAIDASDYAQIKSADYYYKLAEAAYKGSEYNLTSYFGLQAKDYYELGGKAEGKVKAAALVDKAMKYSNGDTYRNFTFYYFGIGDYAQAISYADKATEEYKRVGETRKLDELADVKKKAQLIPNAELYINQSRRFFDDGMYANASASAASAKTAYVALGNDALAREASGIAEKSAIYIEFYRQLDAAFRYAEANDHGNSTHHLILAKAEYDKLNDTYLLPQYENASTMAGLIKRDKDVVVYGGIGVVALIVLLIAVAAVLMIVYFFQKGGFSAFGKMLEGKGPRENKYSSSPQDGSGGLRELRGKRGESIGDSFKR
ncbi:MAG: FG-GAP-like repeat-containing protein [Candidatus Altiarchaeota archaeon]